MSRFQGDPERVTVLERVTTRLYAVEYPVLRRPAVPYGEPPTAELIAWAIDVYTFSLTTHVRQLLESFCLLARSRHWPTTFLVGRALIEVSGHAVHVMRDLRAALGRADFPAAWGLLEAATFGSRTFRERGVSPEGETTLWPAPIHAMDDVRALAEWIPGETRKEREKSAEDIYGHLSEFCHPNIGAFNQYVRYEEHSNDVFMSIDPVPGAEPPEHEVVISMAAALATANGLLGLYGHHPGIASHFRSVLDFLVDAGRKWPDSN